MKWSSSSYVLTLWAKAFQTSSCKYFSFRKYCTVWQTKRHFSLTDVCFGFVFFKHKCSFYLMPKEKTGSRSPSNNKLCTIFIFGFLEYFFTGLCVGFISFVNILLRGLLLFYPHLAHSPSMIWVFFLLRNEQIKCAF